jgi:hypothetical protein
LRAHDLILFCDMMFDELLKNPDDETFCSFWAREAWKLTEFERSRVLFAVYETAWNMTEMKQAQAMRASPSLDSIVQMNTAHRYFAVFKLLGDHLKRMKAERPSAGHLPTL